MRDSFSQFAFKMPRVSGKAIKTIIGIVIILILVFGSIYQVSPEEVGVILRFGKYVRTTGPGLHMKFPLGIEKVIKVPVQRQLKMEFGFRTIKPGVRTEYVVTPEAEKEAVMLTGDLNVVVVEWIVQYKIKDPYNYLFKMRNVEDTFRYMNEAVVRKVVGDHSVDEVLTIGRAKIASEAKEELQRLCDMYEIGIEVSQLILQDVNPPDPVKPSFNEVNEALQEKERKINEAWAEYNQEIPKAKGEAEQMIRAAEGYATERINKAMGDAKRFIQIYKEYSRAPEITRRRLYLEALEKVLPELKRKIIIDEKLKSLIPLLELKEEVKKNE
ncbi:FtsH protease activity modulator HflK [Candidatus Aminicenantes bacterium AC-335-B20]|jgi:membrane protease subunit HflK|nr:FtsH protease activity modulator HflK [SCandidatus Aminicenantes bacterium Aminicenantia_JdfR_composite]MCP2597429.1 FtsH protease activity modulator HflK [Candidatus Aminicenantes bacterium AC-335-G13]MCP2599233.1 FtsH protease activity modulator HflK [Candidatus Aminicenantes bacterium AC-335-B20]MCP2620745.1 FtsH protease activity modulator HflK [Candidatus Aminicenantes bacterium AC-334-E05]